MSIFKTYYGDVEISEDSLTISGKVDAVLDIFSKNCKSGDFEIIYTDVLRRVSKTYKGVFEDFDGFDEEDSLSLFSINGEEGFEKERFESFGWSSRGLSRKILGLSEVNWSSKGGESLSIKSSVPYQITSYTHPVGVLVMDNVTYFDSAILDKIRCDKHFYDFNFKKDQEFKLYFKECDKKSYSHMFDFKCVKLNHTSSISIITKRGDDKDLFEFVSMYNLINRLDSERSSKDRRDNGEWIGYNKGFKLVQIVKEVDESIEAPVIENQSSLLARINTLEQTCRDLQQNNIKIKQELNTANQKIKNFGEAKKKTSNK